LSGLRAWFCIQKTWAHALTIAGEHAFVGYPRGDADHEASPALGLTRVAILCHAPSTAPVC
jgi:hypothetical protein